MSLKWKCVNSSFLVLKHEAPDNREACVSGTEEQSQTPIIEEQSCSEVTELTECDTKNGISVGVEEAGVSGMEEQSQGPTIEK